MDSAAKERPWVSKHSGGEVDLQGSDVDLGEEEELEWTAGEGNGKHTKTGKSEEAIERLAAKVPEAYRSVFRRVHELQKTRREMRENDEDDQERIGGESEKRWYPHGLPNDDEEYEKRMAGDGKTAKLSASSRAALPRLRVEDIPRILQDTGPLAFEMLQLTFPPQALELVRDMTNKYFEFCQSREPDTGRKKRHEAK